MRQAIRLDTGQHSRVDTMSSDRWLTYADAASLLGMTIDSLRHRARRENWGKRLNNEGKAIVLVPVDVIPIPGGDAGGDPPGDAIAVRPAKRPASHPDADAVAVHLARIADLERRIAELRSDLDAARQDRDRERDGRQVERDERQVERERADRANCELAEIAKQFAALTASASTAAQAREMALEARLEAVRAEAAALRDRPWWRRLAG